MTDEWTNVSTSFSMLDDYLYIPTKYNSQLDNKNYDRLKNWAQCGYTSAAVFLSAWLSDYNDDAGVESIINEIDSDYINKLSNHRKGAFQKNYSEFFKKKLPKNEIITKTNGGTLTDVLNSLRSGSPLFTSTMLTKSGHYVTIVGYNFTRKSFVVNDPYGKFDFDRGRYIDTSIGAGKDVFYPTVEFSVAMEKSSQVAVGGSGFRFIYAP